MRVIGIAGAMALGVMSWTASAQETAPVLARAALLQPPVWLERAGERQALRPGAAVYAGDRFETGARGRLQLELEDSSTLKLGSSAQLELPALQVVDDGAEGLLKGTLKVLRGAFRYTAGALAGLRKRELDVYVGPTITAGIRGTDFWARSEPGQELLCLLEGQLEVGSPGYPSQVMDQPRTFYVVPRGQPPRPIAPTPPDKLPTWLPQTEMDVASVALSAAGRFRLVLRSLGTEAQAQREAERLAALGYATELQAYGAPGQTRYRILLPGFETREAAQRYARALPASLGLPLPWVLAPN